jgi:hypothetical protein
VDGMIVVKLIVEVEVVLVSRKEHENEGTDYQINTRPKQIKL